VRQIPSRPFTLGLIPVVLGQVVFLGGCGGSDASDTATAQAPPKNQMEGLQRIKESNIKYDQQAPINQRSGATKSKK
jgi:hypothetical protein